MERGVAELPDEEDTSAAAVLAPDLEGCSFDLAAQGTAIEAEPHLRRRVSPERLHPL